MADDPREAIGIIGALSDAGLLRPAASGTPESSAASETIRIIGVLRDAGLLGTDTVGPAVAPDPLQGPQVGDIAWAQDIRQVNKQVYSAEAKGVTFVSSQGEGRWWQIQCDFPPNDEHWLAEIDNFLGSPKPSNLGLKFEITKVMGIYPPSTMYLAKLMDLRALYRTPGLPPWTGM